MLGDAMARTIRAVVLIFTIVAKGAFAQGSEYPTRPVKIIVPYAPAGPADVLPLSPSAGRWFL
jgi:tripartite-type tricarboxylate transporter receptor subunit TctC